MDRLLNVRLSKRQGGVTKLVEFIDPHKRTAHQARQERKIFGAGSTAICFSIILFPFIL